MILGLTQNGNAFRPSDWAERLAGVMSQFKPGGSSSRGLGYSPWCVPSIHDGKNCIKLHRDLRKHEVMAWDFCVNFAKDNDLQVIEDNLG